MGHAVSGSYSVASGHAVSRRRRSVRGTVEGAVEDRHLRCNQLLMAAARGDRASFHRLYAQSSAQLFAVVRRAVWHRGEAEEVLQEVYLKLWRHAHSFDPTQAHALAWMSRMARNQAIDHLRSQSARGTSDARAPAHAAEQPPDLSIDTAPRPDEHLERQQLRQRIDHLMATLSGTQRQVVQMAFREGRSQAEIAAQLGKPLGSVKSWMRRALQQMRHTIDHAEQGHTRSSAA